MMILRACKIIGLTMLTAAILSACGGNKYEMINLESRAAQKEEEQIAESLEESIAEEEKIDLPETVYVRVGTNLYVSPDDISLGAFEPQGTRLEVIGYDKKEDDSSVRMLQVRDGKNSGYIRPWYVAETSEEAARPVVIASPENAAYGSDQYFYSLHATRGDSYGGGDAGDLDYYDRDHDWTPKSEMPKVCKTLYVPGYGNTISNIDEYLDIANSSGINAFVVDISDNMVIAYESPFMEKNCPSAYKYAGNSLERYADAIRKIKEAGYYVIGRITAFHDDYLCEDHNEYAITDAEGNITEVAGGYWPTAFNRKVWEYKLGLAQEAVDLFDFDEIQFDYVRFPDRTRKLEEEGTIDLHNEVGESKAQAISRFLMYVVDNLHEKGIRVSADVFGETSNEYVAAYGQYWPAITNIVDVISAMPYCDHYESIGDWNPWEHPYEILQMFGEKAVERQKECPTPAIVRTWIQCYDSIKKPKVIYGPENVGLEIKSLFSLGLDGGYLTWHGQGNTEKYRSLIPAFDINPEDCKPVNEDEPAENEQVTNVVIEAE